MLKSHQVLFMCNREASITLILGQLVQLVDATKRANEELEKKFDILKDLIIRGQQPSFAQPSTPLLGNEIMSTT